MSFTAIVKNEIINLDLTATETISELSALIKNNGNRSSTLKINTENSNVANFIYKSIKQIYGIVPIITVRKGYNFHKNYIYIIEIKKNIDNILNDLGIYQNKKRLDTPPLYLLSDEDLISAYIIGVFLASGSINDPKTSRYHLEFGLEEQVYANFISSLLNNYQLNSKIIKRDTKYMVYIKEAEKISDFLRMIKAHKAVLYYENIRIYREQKNVLNRISNCEQANIDKLIQTAFKQVKQIEYLKEHKIFDLLEPKLKQVAEYRLKYPDTSLTELSEIISIETGKRITKSGLYHRFKKIETFINKVRE